MYTALSSYTNTRLMFSVVQMTWNEVHSNMFYSTFLHMARHLICTNMAYDLIIKKNDQNKNIFQKISIMGSKCVGEMGPCVHSVFAVFSFVHSSLRVIPILSVPHFIVPFHKPLQWRHDERYGDSRHQCLFNCWFRRRSEKTSKLPVTGLFEGNSLVTGEFPD